MAETAGRVLHGTCGWSDPSIVACGRFYPKNVKTSTDKLEVFSKTFACVEVRGDRLCVCADRNRGNALENQKEPGHRCSNLRTRNCLSQGFQHCHNSV